MEKEKKINKSYPACLILSKPIVEKKHINDTFEARVAYLEEAQGNHFFNQYPNRFI